MIDLLKIHPMTTLLGASGDALSNMVHPSDEMTVSAHRYFTGDGKLDIDSYRKVIESLRIKKAS